MREGVNGMSQSIIEFAAIKAVLETPDLAARELVRLARREAELEEEIARLKERYHADV
jgi:cell division protein FtsB